MISRSFLVIFLALLLLITWNEVLCFPSCRYSGPAVPQKALRGMNLVMRERKCDITGQRKNSKCMSVSKSHVRIHKVQGVNLQWRKLWWPEESKYVRMRVATRTLRTIAKYGLHRTALKYGCNLHDFVIEGAVQRPMYVPPPPKEVKKADDDNDNSDDNMLELDVGSEFAQQS